MLLVFAGPNGSGKSTIARCVDILGVYVNADEIRQRDHSISEMDAAIEAEALREYCLRERLDFSFERAIAAEDKNI